MFEIEWTYHRVTQQVTDNRPACVQHIFFPGYNNVQDLRIHALESLFTVLHSAHADEFARSWVKDGIEMATFGPPGASILVVSMEWLGTCIHSDRKPP